MTMKHKVCVLGAGVIGLSSAVRIQESMRDVDVTLIAEKFTPDTTSDGSGGFWEPHLVNEDQADLIKKWGDETFSYLLHLSKSNLATKLGAQMISGYSLSDHPMNPSWRHDVLGYREVGEEELKLFPGSKYGSFFTTVMIEVPAYLQWMLNRFESMGGKVVKRKVQKLDELFNDFDVVVNCTGLGSRELLQDHNMTPVRGQVIKVRAPWLKHFVTQLITDNVFYILPGTRVATLGGTTGIGDWNTDVNKKDKDRIWNGCLNLFPSLQDAEIVNDWVGLRPLRTVVRLEMEQCRKGSKVITLVHNYGHSGSGVTLHWGCAGHTVQLIKEGIQKLPLKSHL